MIETKQLCKSFRGKRAISDVSVCIQENGIFGLIGSNGAGKSTFLRMLCGVLKPDRGEVLVDGKCVYENETLKRQICFLPDTSYFLPNATAGMMRNYYELLYPSFDSEKFQKLMERFKQESNCKLSSLSKGRKKQIAILLGICTNAKYLLCDETFDGLDPVMRQAVKGLLVAEMTKRDFTPVIASHNLRELEDICDHVGLLHKGGVLFTKDLDEMKFHIHKVQCVLREPFEEEQVLAELDVLKHEKRGSLLTIVARGTRMEILDCIDSKKPVFSEVLPLSLEEIFISETEVAGYGIKDFL